MTIRESGVVTGISWAMAVWALGFAVNIFFAADRLTSPQWQALMTVPGGKWFWITVFAGAGVTLVSGLVDTCYRARAIGLGIVGLGCGGIATFYMLAPFFNLGPVTFGYWPWFLGVGVGIMGAIANWWPLEWF